MDIYTVVQEFFRIKDRESGARLWNITLLISIAVLLTIGTVWMEAWVYYAIGFIFAFYLIFAPKLSIYVIAQMGDRFLTKTVPDELLLWLADHPSLAITTKEKIATRLVSQGQLTYDELYNLGKSIRKEKDLEAQADQPGYRKLIEFSHKK